MEKMVLILHVVVCILLILLVLLQAGKEGMGVIFGGGNTSLFGSSGAGGILVKLTTFVAIVFFATSLGYNVLTSPKYQQESSMIEMARQNPFIEQIPVDGALPAKTDTPATTPATNATAPATNAATPATNATAPATNAATPATNATAPVN